MSSDEDSDSSSRPNPRLVQYMMRNQCVKHSQLMEFLEKDNQQDVFQIVTEANRLLKRHNMLIRSATDVTSRENYYVFISSVDNPVTRMAQHHSPREFEYFKLILKRLQDSDSLRSSELRGLAEQAGFPGSIKSLMDEWVAKFWLRKNNDDSYSLGVRSDAELDVFRPSET